MVMESSALVCAAVLPLSSLDTAFVDAIFQFTKPRKSSQQKLQNPAYIGCHAMCAQDVTCSSVDVKFGHGGPLTRI